MNSLIRPELLSVTTEQMMSIMPMIIVSCGAALVLILSVVRSFSPKYPVYFVSGITLFAAMVASAGQMDLGPQMIFGGMLVVDSFAHFFNILYLGCGLLTLMGSLSYLDKEDLQYPEYNVLLLFAVLGMMLMSSTTDFISFFIALEIMSLSIYVLVGFRRSDRRSNESAMKYFILGSAASAILLYGVAMVYGATGSTTYPAIYEYVKLNSAALSPLFALGSLLILCGFLFKVASAPFHMWMPDVYEGAPTPITGLMTTGVKAASFAALMRVVSGLGFVVPAPAFFKDHFYEILWGCAVLTMILGNVIALTQTNLKRMLAYSSIAHTGYLLVGLVAALKGGGQGFGPIALYVLTYAVMNMGAFMVLGLIGERHDFGLNLPDLSGLSQKSPFLAFSLSLFLLSMAGIPPTAGFASKYLLFYSAVEAGETPLVIISVICSAISVYYYLRVLVYMYMRDPVVKEHHKQSSGLGWVALAISVILTLQVGMMPSKWMEVAKKAVSSLVL